MEVFILEGIFYNVSPFILGCDTLIRTSSECVFVSKLGRNLCPDTLESVNNIQPENSIVLFPNPFDTKLSITKKGSEQTQIILYDILSRKLLQQTFTNSATINTEELADGIYIYELMNKSGSIANGKLFKQ